MDYDALTIDTQTVETNSFHFDGGLLAQLKQFANGPTKVVVAQIVAAEILRHLREKTQATKDAVESAHKKALLFGLRESGDVPFVETPDVPALARKRLAKYFEEIGATIISADDVPMRDLEDVELALSHYEIDEDNGWYPAQVVQVGRATIVVDVEVRAFVNAEATFSLAVHDSVDDDYVSLGDIPIKGIPIFGEQ